MPLCMRGGGESGRPICLECVVGEPAQDLIEDAPSQCPICFVCQRVLEANCAGMNTVVMLVSGGVSSEWRVVTVASSFGSECNLLWGQERLCGMESLMFEHAVSQSASEEQVSATGQCRESEYRPDELEFFPIVHNSYCKQFRPLYYRYEL